MKDDGYKKKKVRDQLSSGEILANYIHRIKKTDMDEQIEKEIISLCDGGTDLTKAAAAYIRRGFFNEDVMSAFFKNNSNLEEAYQEGLLKSIKYFNKESFDYFLNKDESFRNKQTSKTKKSTYVTRTLQAYYLLEVCSYTGNMGARIFESSKVEKSIYFIDALVRKNPIAATGNKENNFQASLRSLLANYREIEPSEKTKQQLSRILKIFLDAGYPIYEPIFEGHYASPRCVNFLKKATILDCMAAVGDNENLSRILNDNTHRITKESINTMAGSAAKNAQLETLRLLKKRGSFDSNYVDEEGKNLAHLLFDNFDLIKSPTGSKKQEGNSFARNKINDMISTFKFLKKEKVNFNQTNGKSKNLNYVMFEKIAQSFIFHDEREKTFEFIDELIKMNIPFYKKKDVSVSPLHFAVSFNSNLPILKHIKDKIKIEPSMRACKNLKNKNSLLQEAIESASYKNAEFLLSIGFEPFTHDGFAKDVIQCGKGFQETINSYYEKHLLAKEVMNGYCEKHSLDTETSEHKLEKIEIEKNKPLRF